MASEVIGGVYQSANVDAIPLPEISEKQSNQALESLHLNGADQEDRFEQNFLIRNGAFTWPASPTAGVLRAETESRPPRGRARPKKCGLEVFCYREGLQTRLLCRVRVRA